VVSAIIAKQGMKIIYESISELSDAGLKPGELDDLISTIKTNDQVIDLQYVRARRLGPFIEFHCTIQVSN